ncbi:17.8 kDa class I heat shock protein [Fagus crenata]
MANVKRSRGTGGRARSHDHNSEEYVPYSGWSEDANGRYLIIDLPEFKRDDLRLQVDSSGHITVTGERLANDGKRIYFEQTFNLPENSDTDNITGKIDGEILYVTVPKQVAEETREHEFVNNDVCGSEQENVHEKPINDKSYRDDHQHGNIHGYGYDSEKEKKRGNAQSAHMEFSEETIKQWERGSTVLRSAVKMLKRNKGIVMTAILAFSLGVLVTHKLVSAGN